MIEPKVTFLQELIVPSPSPTIEPMVTDDERAAFAARLNRLLDKRQFALKGAGRQLKLGQLMGVSQKGARKWLVGESIPEMARLIELARHFDVPLEWLATNRIDGIEADDVPESTGAAPFVAESMPPIVARINALIDGLTPAQQEDLVAQIEAQVKENDKLEVELAGRRLRSVKATNAPHSEFLERVEAPVQRKGNKATKEQLKK